MTEKKAFLTFIQQWSWTGFCLIFLDYSPYPLHPPSENTLMLVVRVTEENELLDRDKWIKVSGWIGTPQPLSQQCLEEMREPEECVSVGTRASEGLLFANQI